MAKGNRYSGMTRDQRFDAKVDVRGEDDCWNWKEGTNGRGYGRFGLGTRQEGQIGSHVYACERAHGPNPGGLDVMHDCDNRLCCNPKHLSYGSRAQNMSDCVRRGRNNAIGPRGEQQHKAMLSSEDVLLIRKNPQIAGAELARRLGVHKATVYDVRAGRTWTHIP